MVDPVVIGMGDGLGGGSLLYKNPGNGIYFL